MDRRRLLQLAGGFGLAALVGCSSNDDGDAASTTSAGAGTPGACEEIAEETAGPFPADGSNGPDVLTEQGVVRQDITSSFGSATGTADGIPLRILVTVTDAAVGCAAKEGMAVYVWQCDREARYSMYPDGAERANYLRGVQPTDDTGTAIFDSIFPGAYRGRWPHIHFEVHRDVDAATSGATPLATSQIALPADACEAAYATKGYEASKTTFAETPLEQDSVFGDDGAVHQLGTVTGRADEGFIVSLTVPVAST